MLYPLPVKRPFYFHSHLLCCFFSSGSTFSCCLWSGSPLQHVAYVCLSLAVCMAGGFSSSVANSTVSCSTCRALSKPVPAKEHVCALLCLCCTVSTAHPGAGTIQSWTTSLILAGVSWSGRFSSSHTQPAWDSKSKALLALGTYLIYP